MERQQQHLVLLQEENFVPLQSHTTKAVPSQEGRATDSASAQTGAAATSRQGQQQSGGEGPEKAARKVCSHCGSGTASRWSSHPTNGKRLSNSCRDYMRNHRGQERPVGVCCLTCNSTSPGPYHSATWRPHPTTGAALGVQPLLLQHSRPPVPGVRGRQPWRQLITLLASAPNS